MLRYAITPGRVELTGAGPILDQLLARCEALAEDGVEYILVREKQLGARGLEGVVRAVVGRVRGSGTRVIVAGPVEVAMAAGANGVHVGSSLGPVARVREAWGEAWVSASCHTLGEVMAARTAGVDGILFAPVFGKVVNGVEVATGVGLERLREACVAAGDVQVFALGGITKENEFSCCSAGASGVAGIRRFFGEHRAKSAISRWGEDSDTAKQTGTRRAALLRGQSSDPHTATGEKLRTRHLLPSKSN